MSDGLITDPVSVSVKDAFHSFICTCKHTGEETKPASKPEYVLLIWYSCSTFSLLNYQWKCTIKFYII